MRSTLRVMYAFPLVLAVLTAAPLAVAQDMDQPMGMQQMTMPMERMATPNAPVIPAVTGYSEGWRILFLHTETSDTEIAQILTDMMGSPVLVVPSLATAQEEMLARVYVFANGATEEGPRGPLGFQPDVFDNPPGSPGYSPLRQVVLVTWREPSSARTLKSAAEVEQAIGNGEVTTEEPGVVVNMPFLTWPTGQR